MRYYGVDGMGELADRLDALVVTVRSPDRQIAAIVRRQGTSIDLRFEPRKYRVYDEDELARQLARLATSAWVRFKRDYDETVRTHWPGVLAPSDDGIDFGPERRAYRLRLECSPRWERPQTVGYESARGRWSAGGSRSLRERFADLRRNSSSRRRTPRSTPYWRTIARR